MHTGPWLSFVLSGRALCWVKSEEGAGSAGVYRREGLSIWYAVMREVRMAGLTADILGQASAPASQPCLHHLGDPC